MSEAEFAILRDVMMREITLSTSQTSEQTGKSELDERVMQAIGQLPRHEFVPLELKAYAYLNTPLPIGHGKTVSQPFIVALMTDLLAPGPEDTVLEIGTGLGYQAALLGRLTQKVYTLELNEDLAEQATKRLKALDCGNVEVRVGDGNQGLPQFAPYDKIMVTAAPDLIPPPLLGQLKPGGRMVIPTGLMESQQLLLVEKSPEGKYQTTEILPVRFSSLDQAEYY
ncbi:MAG: protein-L-isoaspartate(D-aspartate) O-methyltransferase [Minwuiales bacterium]|nr:protein-L-isoaspartate(D-aspartate) O-methyltransferase [Minwuiales bacterium]